MWKLNQTLRGSFSAVSKPNFASKYSLESSWRDLQDLHAFAPLRPQYFSKFSSNFLAFSKLDILKSSIFFKFRRDFHWFSWNLLGFSWKCRKTLQLLKMSRSQFRFNFQTDLIFKWFNFQIFDLTFNLIFTEPPRPGLRASEGLRLRRRLRVGQAHGLRLRLSLLPRLGWVAGSTIYM